MIDITGGSMKSKAAVALGIFDGVHCGHRKIIKAAVDYSKKGLTPAVFTFPADAISTENRMSLFTGTDRKLIYLADWEQNTFIRLI